MSITEERHPDSQPPMDPRLRARRIAVRRDEGRRRLRRVIALGVVATTIVLCVAVTQSPLFDVDRVTVSGAAHTPVDAIRQASAVQRHQPMTAVDLDRARRGILALPWVASVSVARRWPSSIVVRVTERTPAAVVPAGQNGFALVDKAGRVLETSPAPPAGFVMLTGVPPAGAAGTSLSADSNDALAVATQLLPTLAPKVSEVVVAPDGVDLHLVAGGTVRLGAATDVLAKLVAADTVLTQADVHDLCTLDVRVASAPSLTQGTTCA